MLSVLSKLWKNLDHAPVSDGEPSHSPPSWVSVDSGHPYISDDEGAPLRLYHATSSVLGRFWPLSHFGTQEAANHAARTRTIRNAVIYPVYIKMKNPLVLEDQGNHTKSYYRDQMAAILTPEEMVHVFGDDRAFSHLFSLASVPETAGYFPDCVSQETREQHKRDFQNYCTAYENEIAELQDSDFFDEAGYHPENLWIQRMCQTLMEKGYDGITYQNLEEDSGNNSWIIFHPSQVVSAVSEKALSPDSVFNPESEPQISQPDSHVVRHRKRTHVPVCPAYQNRALIDKRF